MPKQLSLCLKNFFWLKKKNQGWGQVWILKQVDLFSLQHSQSLLCDSTSWTCFYWCHMNWTPDLSRGESEHLVWGSAISHWAWGWSFLGAQPPKPLVCSLPGRGPPGRGWQLPRPSKGLYLLQSAFSLPVWPCQQPGEAGPAGHVILAPQRRKGKLTQAGGGRPRLEPAVITQPPWTCWSPCLGKLLLPWEASTPFQILCSPSNLV